MSRTATTVKPLSGEVTIRQLRKGVPDEYKELLAKGKADTIIMVGKAKEEAEKLKEEAKGKAAKIYVPKLYNCLIKYDYPPKSARSIITADCTMWSFAYIDKFMPAETKHPGRRIGGKASAKAREVRRAKEQKEALEKAEIILPDIKKESEETKKAAIKMITGMNSPLVTPEQRVEQATLGGIGKRDKYGNKVFSEMGDRSAEVRHGTYKVGINFEEHKEISAAFEKSLMAGAGGCYTIYVRDGEYERVEADLNGDAEKTVNR